MSETNGPSATLSAGAIVTIALAMMAASVSPNAFVLSATGFMTLHKLGEIAILPAVVIWLGLFAFSSIAGWREISSTFKLAIIGGVLGTIAMEIVRITGFRLFDAMPGSIPMLLGVQLTDRAMQGPDLVSDTIGYMDHFTNGISFVFLYIALFGRQRWFVGVLYGIGIATVFMVSPVMSITGAGLFGQAFAPIKFPVTVYLAHIAYGATFGFILQQAASTPERSLVLTILKTIAGALDPRHRNHMIARH
ncbi:hypothetical protein [Acidiphilium sp.]|uniref:hypothetical protein n=1 Tax=Acidiphilium sp. TaxID=527 RepID=UPI003CFD551E